MIRRFLIWPLAALAMATLAGCAAPEVRPELAVITSPIDDVWVAFVQLTKESGFEIESAESSRHLIIAGKDTTALLRGAPDPYQRTPRATQKQHHDLRVSMHPRGDQSTAVEITYTIDKVPDEDAGFALLNAVRERLALEAR
jgi:hypothetical protein